MSITRDQAREAIYQRFVAVWGAEPRTQFFLGDEEAKPGTEPWVRLSVVHEAPQRLSVSAAGVRVRQSGTIYLQYFQSPKEDSEVADGHMQSFIDGFGFQKLLDSSIRTQEAFARELGLVEKAQYWAARGQTDFYYDTVQ